MPARTKRRAKFDFNGRPFLWWIDGDGWLRICSADKKFVVALDLVQSANAPARLQVIGPEFPGAAGDISRPLLTQLDGVFQPSMGATVHAVLAKVFGKS
jgi:hypothetical protein